jgi:hypothetical protein
MPPRSTPYPDASSHAAGPDNAATRVRAFLDSRAQDALLSPSLSPSAYSSTIAIAGHPLRRLQVEDLEALLQTIEILRDAVHQYEQDTQRAAP